MTWVDFQVKSCSPFSRWIIVVNWLLFSYLNNHIHCLRKREEKNEERWCVFVGCGFIGSDVLWRMFEGRERCTSIIKPLFHWEDNTDCCLWEEVMCNTTTGRVAKLYLEGINDGSPWHLNYSDFTVFKDLNTLDLSFNEIVGCAKIDQGYFSNKLYILIISYLNYYYYYYYVTNESVTTISIIFTYIFCRVRKSRSP